MVVDTRQHLMPVNDINHCWSVEIDGVETFFGQCTCGKIWSSPETIDVSRAYVKHTYEVELERRRQGWEA
jgi:hypothetical protein